MTEVSPLSSVGRGTINFAYLVPICIVAALGGLLFGYDTGVISGAIEPLAQHFHLSDALKGWASGCVLIGCAIGVLVIGPISDRFGRKQALLAASIIFLLSAIGSAVPTDFTTFVLSRILAGIGIGMASITTPMYLAEITPAAYRGRFVAANQIAIVGGIVLTSFINYYLAQRHPELSPDAKQLWLSESGWRWMFATGIIPSAAFLVTIFWIPESPRWLLEHKEFETAKTILHRIGGDNYARQEMSPIKAQFAGLDSSWVSIFAKRYRRPLWIGIALAVLQQVTGINVFLYFGATIFRHLGDATGLDAGLLQQIIINGACMLFTLVAIITVDKWGRRPLMLIGSIGMGLSLLAMGAAAQWFPGAPAAMSLMLGFIILYIACFGLSVGPVTWVILSEIFPTAIRGRALGVATFFLWLADYIVTQTFPMLDAAGSWSVNVFHHALPFYIYAGFCAVLAIVMIVAVPETKGRTLEGIEKSWG